MEAIHSISEAAKILQHAIDFVQQKGPSGQSQYTRELVHHCAKKMLSVVCRVSDQQQAAPSISPALVNDLQQFFTERETAQLAANVAHQLQQSVQSTAAAMQRF